MYSVTYLYPPTYCDEFMLFFSNRTVIFLELGAKVVAIEPQEACYKRLIKRFGNQITLVKKGLGAQESVEKLYVSELSAISSFSKEIIGLIENKQILKCSQTCYRNSDGKKCHFNNFCNGES